MTQSQALAPNAGDISIADWNNQDETFLKDILQKINLTDGGTKPFRGYLISQVTYDHIFNLILNYVDLAYEEQGDILVFEHPELLPDNTQTEKIPHKFGNEKFYKFLTFFHPREDWDNLKKLDLSGYDIYPALPDDFPKHFSKLEELDISNNKIQSLPSEFCFVCLEQLKWNNNDLEQFWDNTNIQKHKSIKKIWYLGNQGYKNSEEKLKHVQELHVDDQQLQFWGAMGERLVFHDKEPAMDL